MDAESRIAKLERRSRILFGLLAAMGIVCLAGNSADTHALVKSKMFALIGPDGEVAGEWECTDSGAVRFTLHSGTDEERTSIVMGITKAGAAIATFADGEPIITLTSMRNGKKSAFIFDGDVTARAFVETN